MLDLGAAGFVADGAQAQAYLLLFHIDLDDLEIVLLALIELGRAAVFAYRLGDMAETFHALGDLNERAELRGAKNLAVHHVAHAMSGEETLPHIGLELLDAQAQAAVLRLHAENDSLHLLALLHDFRRVLDALGPAQVGDVHQAVDAVFDLDEGSEVGEVANAAFDDGAGGVALGKVLPGVLQELLHAQRNAAIGRVHAENDCLDFIPGLD